MRDFYNMSKERLEATVHSTEAWLERAKADVAKYEEQLKVVTDALKNFGTDKVQPKVEEAVEAVKEEVKKAAPKKTAAKKAEPEVEEVAEEPKTDK